jgi:hypothetical protein
MRRLTLVALAVVLTACADESTGAGVGGAPSTTSTGGDEQAPTWFGDVMPIVYDKCVGCHADGGVGAFPLVDYEIVSIAEDVIADVVEKHNMPPWLVDPSGACQSWAGARTLSVDEIDVIGRWARARAPKGDAREAPPIAPVEPLAEVTHTLDPGEGFTPAQNPLASAIYRCFLVDPELASDGYLTAYLVRPSDARMVHGVTFYALDDDQAEEDALALLAADEIPGYECFGGPRIAGARLLGAWAGGSPAMKYPARSGIPLHAGRRAIVRVHYNTHQVISEDRTVIDLTVAPRVGAVGELLPVEDAALALPPGLAEAHAGTSVPVPGAGAIWGVFPHMHLLGKTLRLDLVRGEEATCVADVASWQFQFEELYPLREPVAVEAGDALRVDCSYDTFGQTVTIHAGEDADDEMCAAYVYLAR